MSVIYDGSGNLQFQTISSIINNYNPYNFTSTSGLIFGTYPTLSGFINGTLTTQYYNTISSTFVKYNLPINPWLIDNTSNRMLSIYLKGFLSISGNIIFQNGGSINNCSSFNGIASSYFNQLLSLTNIINTNNFVTQLASNNSQLCATTAYVKSQNYLTSQTQQTTAITQVSSDNSTNIATTAYVKSQNYLTSVPIQTLTVTQATTDNSTNIASTQYVKNQLYLTSVPIQTVTVTQATTDNSTNIASTSYVKSQSYITNSIYHQLILGQIIKYF
jgi:hypothetical protein